MACRATTWKTLGNGGGESVRGARLPRMPPLCTGRLQRTCRSRPVAALGCADRVSRGPQADCRYYPQRQQHRAGSAFCGPAAPLLGVRHQRFVLKASVCGTRRWGRTLAPATKALRIYLCYFSRLCCNSCRCSGATVARDSAALGTSPVSCAYNLCLLFFPERCFGVASAAV